MVTMVLSRAARKTEEQREIMMIAVWSFEREASGAAGGDAFSFAAMGGVLLLDASWSVDVEDSCGNVVLLVEGST